MNKRFMCITGRILMLSMLSLSMPLQSVQAAMIGADKVTTSATQVQFDRARVQSLIDRDDVRAALQQEGIDTQTAHARVNALTDDEVQQLAGKLDQLPAGGDVLGVLLTIFIVLLVTDILGFTKVFPFTRSITRPAR